MPAAGTKKGPDGNYYKVGERGELIGFVKLETPNSDEVTSDSDIHVTDAFESTVGADDRHDKSQRTSGAHRRRQHKHTLSPEHIKHKQEMIAKLSRDLAKEKQLEGFRIQISPAKKLDRAFDGEFDRMSGSDPGASCANAAPSGPGAPFNPSIGITSASESPPTSEIPRPPDNVNASGVSSNIMPPPGPPPPIAASIPAGQPTIAGASPDLVAFLTDNFNKLNARLDAQLTKADLESAVQAETAPIRADLTALTTRVSTLENNTSSTVDDRHDPARKKVSFIGFPDNVAAADRLNEIEKFVQQFPAYKAVSFSNKYRGPHNDLKLSNVGFVEFADKNTATAFLRDAKDANKLKITVVGKEVSVKPALTKLQESRNWAIKKAEELIKAASPGVSVVREKGTLKVQDSAVFSQPKGDPRGIFSGAFAHLTLPA